MIRAGFWFSGIIAFLLFTNASPAADPPGKRSEAGAVEVRFHDGSTLKLLVREEKVELQTAYGKLQIPVADVSRIDFGLRLPEETAQRIQAAIDALTSAQPKDREKAEADLLAQREKAIPALVQASKHA